MVIIIMEAITTEDTQITIMVVIRIIMEDTQTITTEDSQTIITEDSQTIIMEDTQIIITEDTQTTIMEDTLTITMEDIQTIIMEGTPTIIMEDIQIIIIMVIQATMVIAGLFSHKFLVLDHQEVIRIRTLQSHLDRSKSPFLKHVIHFLSKLIVNLT